MSEGRRIVIFMSRFDEGYSLQGGIQLALDDHGVPLHEVTFVVVDLETTGGRRDSSAITEIGAVKVRGGQVEGEYQTLVNPEMTIPPFIVRLTGITNFMVEDAPRIENVLPSFLEFLGDAVLVAHNAPFDVGFLRAACKEHGYDWPGNEVVDTVQLARRVVPKDEAPNHKLSTLAQLFKVSVTPDHRALSDARATVDVLHALLERLASQGVTHSSDLATAGDNVPDDVRKKHVLANGLPSGPGVYLFHGPNDEVLYIGKATSIRTRVRTYFTAAEKRRRMTEMVRLSSRISAIPCASVLEAEVREIRLIGEHRPPYNRRSKHPEAAYWVTMSTRGQRKAVVTRKDPSLGKENRTKVAGDQTQAESGVGLPLPLGPFGSRSRAQRAASAIQRALLLEAKASLPRDTPQDVVTALMEQIRSHAVVERFEAAAQLRDDLEAFLWGGDRATRHHSLRQAGVIICAREAALERWEIHVINCGRLVSAASCRNVYDVENIAAAAAMTAQYLDPSGGAGTLAEELDLVDRWLQSDGVRLLSVSGELSQPTDSPGKQIAELF